MIPQAISATKFCVSTPLTLFLLLTNIVLTGICIILPDNGHRLSRGNMPRSINWWVYPSAFLWLQFLRKMFVNASGMVRSFSLYHGMLGFLPWKDDCWHAIFLGNLREIFDTFYSSSGKKHMTTYVLAWLKFYGQSLFARFSALYAWISVVICHLIAHTLCHHFQDCLLLLRHLFLARAFFWLCVML